MNTVMLIGRLATAVELRTYDERRRATFLLAVERDGARGVDFVPVVGWNEIADACAEHGKDERLAIEGSIRSSRWEDAGGNEHRGLEVVATKTQPLPAAQEAMPES